jgi:hypothetical protein
MELNINDLEYDDLEYNYAPDQYESSYDQIPENNIPIKVIRTTVEPVKPMMQSIPKVNARIVRPKIPEPRPQISYDDILSKMGMFVSEGKLHLLDDKTPQQKKEFKQQYQQRQNQYQNQNQLHNQNQIHPQNQHKNQIQHEHTNIPQNSYIYNKYFKDEMQTPDTIRQPTTMKEYTTMLLTNILQKEKIKQIKSTKLMMPTSNINISSGNASNLDKLFGFSKR